ncbi:MAG: hypothetical protein HY543_00210 [Deltaproteobacteria bacterium]|nr:hypothetical protein [Deltaproteobacteria bacterium]
MNAAHWYIIQTKPKKEGVVCEQLGRASYELFFPKMRALDRVKPLFPSYLFIRTDFSDPTLHRLVRFTRGVTRILGGASPKPVPDDLVDTLRTRTRDGALIEQTLLFKEGDQVRVRRGILKDLAGIIEKNMPEAGRVRVLFKWLRSCMRAVVTYTDLERAPV